MISAHHFIGKKILDWVWYLTPVIPTPGRQRQEHYSKFQDSLLCTALRLQERKRKGENSDLNTNLPQSQKASISVSRHSFPTLNFKQMVVHACHLSKSILSYKPTWAI